LNRENRNFAAAAIALLPIALGYPAPANAVPIDVTQPGDAIQLVNGSNDGDGNSGPPPTFEGVEHAIDNVGQKYLNFLDLGSGFIVTPTLGASAFGTIVTGLRLYTANDAEARDPASYVLEGADAPGGPFSLISQGRLGLPAGRNPGGSTPVDVTSAFQELTFSNSTAYFSYRLTFPDLKDAASANSMQIGEVEFLGELATTRNAVPEPSTIGLLGLGLLGMTTRMRRPTKNR